MPPTYADHDNDGLPDHLMGADGMWQPFDPHTGTMLGGGSSLSPAPPAHNSSTGVMRSGVGGGAQGRLPTPASSPAPPSPLGGGGMPPAFRNGQQHPAFGGPPRQAGGPAAQQPSAPRQGQLGFNPSPLSQGNRAFNSSGHPYGGGGGGGDAIRGMIAGVRSNALSKIGAMMPGSGGAAPTSSSGYAFPSSSGSSLSAAPSSAPTYDPMATALSTLVPMVGAIATGKNMDPRAVGAYQAVADRMIGHIMKKHDDMPLSRTASKVRRKLF